MRRAHFKVTGRNFNRAPAATVTIEIGQGHSLLSVRPHRRRKRYTLPLEAVAAWVIERCVKLELREKRIR